MQILLDFYSNRPHAIQLEVASDAYENERHMREAALTVFCAFLICPLLPALLILGWNIAQPRRVGGGVGDRKGGSSTGGGSSSSALSGFEDGKTAAAMVASGANVNVGGDGAIVDVAEGGASIRCAPRWSVRGVCVNLVARRSTSVVVVYCDRFVAGQKRLLAPRAALCRAPHCSALSSLRLCFLSPLSVHLSLAAHAGPHLQVRRARQPRAAHQVWPA